MNQLVSTALFLIMGLAGGLIAKTLGTPIPFLIGSLVAVASFVILAPTRITDRMTYPSKIREAFVVVIGTMIGGTFTASALQEFQNIWLSIPAVLVFFAAALTVNYQIFRRLGRYDRPTAFYASQPGGLVDSVTLGEQAGGSVPILTTQHFVRIVLIVTLVPLGFWLWTGDTVGSAAGVSLNVTKATLTPQDTAIIAACAVIGFVVGRAIRLPAYFFMGPLIASAIAHGTGMTDGQLPNWVLEIAQLVVGTSFGVKFKSMSRSALAKSAGLGLVSSLAMLSIGGVIALILSNYLPQTFDVLFLCFAPGGISEMGLIALSLNTSPVFVTAHHLVRILVTVGFSALALRWIRK